MIPASVSEGKSLNPPLRQTSSPSQRLSEAISGGGGGGEEGTMSVSFIKPGQHSVHGPCGHGEAVATKGRSSTARALSSTVAPAEDTRCNASSRDRPGWPSLACRRNRPGAATSACAAADLRRLLPQESPGPLGRSGQHQGHYPGPTCDGL